MLAEIVRLDRVHHRPLAGDSDQGEAIKLTARTHQSLVWDRTRHVLRLRSAVRDFFPVALQAFPDLDAPDALELLRRAPDPDQAARLTRSRITAALRRVNRRDVEDKTAQLQAMLRAEQLRQPPVIQSAYAAIVTSQVAICRGAWLSAGHWICSAVRQVANTKTSRSPCRPAGRFDLIRAALADYEFDVVGAGKVLG